MRDHFFESMVAIVCFVGIVLCFFVDGIIRIFVWS